MVLKVGPSLGVVAAGVLSGISILSLFVSRPFSGRTGQEMDETYKDFEHMTVFFQITEKGLKAWRRSFKKAGIRILPFTNMQGARCGRESLPITIARWMKIERISISHL